ncbi:MAG: glycosyltransferase [Myxococcota bacterium]|nr:glycosyltransferase [Myxococcota bacterium]
MTPLALLNASRVPVVDFEDGADGRVLVLSMRQIADLVGYCALYEFEDAVTNLMGADMGKFVHVDHLQLARRIYRVARYVSGSPRIAESVMPPTGAQPLKKKYDFLFAVFNHPHEIFALNALRDWREQCRFAACYLCEAWEAQLPVYLVEMLEKFDHVFVGVKGTVDAVARISGRPCTYLPMGVDSLRFCPYPSPAARSIDICGIGRRSRVTHEALLDYATKNNLFYYYDTIQLGAVKGSSKNMTFRVSNPREHRMLLAGLLKRSRYFIANRAWADRPALTRGKDEIAARFYEGAAAGTIMVGEPPDSDDFRTQFGWSDSVIRIPFNAPGVADVIAELDGDPVRSSKIREDSVVNSLLHHDWVYRLRAVLKTAGLHPTERLLAREAALTTMAREIRQGGDEQRLRA